MWFPQRCGSAASLAVSQLPVMLEAIGIWGARRVVVAMRSVNRGTTGSMAAEWNAWRVMSRRPVIPADDRELVMRSSFLSLPASTTSIGELIAATSTFSVLAASMTISATPWNEIIVPVWQAAMRRPRSQTRKEAVSRSIIPAATAAANSPMLCPNTTLGVRPRVSRAFVHAYWTAKSRG